MQCFVVFDLVYLNGESWHEKPLRERKRMLSHILQPDNERIILASYSVMLPVAS